MVGILGYARVSTQQQDLDAQRERLKKAGAIRIFEDVISGKVFNRPGLTDLTPMLGQMTSSVWYGLTA